MLPQLTILGRSLPTYGVLGMAGVLAGLLCAAARSRRFGLSADDTAYIYVFGAVGALLGAKALYLLTVLPQLTADLALLRTQPQLFWTRYLYGGMVFYGGFAGGLLGAAWAARQYRVRLSAFVPVLAPALALAHGIARLGCFCAGCCYGVPSARFGIAFSHSLSAPNGVPLLPVQLYEAAGELAIFAFLLWFTAQPRRAPYALYAYVFAYAPLRFVLEFWRGDSVRGRWAGLSTSQWLSLAALAAAAFCLRRAAVRTAAAPDAPAGS